MHSHDLVVVEGFYSRDMPPARIKRIKLDASLILLHGHQRYQNLVVQAEARWAAVQADQAGASS